MELQTLGPSVRDNAIFKTMCLGCNPTLCAMFMLCVAAPITSNIVCVARRYSLLLCYAAEPEEPGSILGLMRARDSGQSTLSREDNRSVNRAQRDSEYSEVRGWSNWVFPS